MDFSLSTLGFRRGRVPPPNRLPVAWMTVVSGCRCSWLPRRPRLLLAEVGVGLPVRSGLEGVGAVGVGHLHLGELGEAPIGETWEADPVGLDFH